MTNEANNNDPRVTEVYREISNEITPPELDRKILAMAAEEGRAKYWIPRAWIRPVAWAATIALSLAFVLEMSQVAEGPAPQVDPLAIEALEERVMSDEDAAKSEDESAVRQRLNKRSDAPATMNVAAPAAPTEQSAPVKSAVDRQEADGASMSLEVEADDMTLLREGEEPARMQFLSVPSAVVAPEKKELPTECDDDAREAPGSWYECVKALRDAGSDTAAQQELESLLAEFPEFREPVLNR